MPPEPDHLLTARPLPAISTRLLWEAIVDIEATQDLGVGLLGRRRIVPILGGEVRADGV